jgi:hypothetical protein
LGGDEFMEQVVKSRFLMDVLRREKSEVVLPEVVVHRRDDVLQSIPGWDSLQDLQCEIAGLEKKLTGLKRQRFMMMYQLGLSTFGQF